MGEALAYELSRKGAKLILSARREEKLKAVRDACERPRDHEILVMDLADIDTIPGIAKKGLASYGKVDILINNGGVSQRSEALETSVDVDRQLMWTNYLGPVALTKALLPSMIERKYGHIVVMSSLTGKFGTPLRSSYAASKHALHGFFDSLRAETWRDGIFVTLVCPGFIKTDISLNALMGDGSRQGKMDQGQANGMSPEKCADKILWAVEKRKNEAVIGGMETLGVLIKRLFPTYFSRMIRDAPVTG